MMPTLTNSFIAANQFNNALDHGTVTGRSSIKYTN